MNTAMKELGCPHFIKWAKTEKIRYELYWKKRIKVNACFESYQWKSTTMEHKPNQEVLSHAHTKNRRAFLSNDELKQINI